MPKTLVAALGHAWLRDQAFGIKVLDELRARRLDPEVELADWSFGTITAFQKLAEGSFDRTIFVSGLHRDGRAPGTLARSDREVELPPDDEIHGRIGDCVMGAVSVDNLLIIARFYGVLPDDFVLIECEPVDDTWGNDLSPALAGTLAGAVEMVLAEIGRPRRPGVAPAPTSAPVAPAAR